MFTGRNHHTAPAVGVENGIGYWLWVDRWWNTKSRVTCSVIQTTNSHTSSKAQVVHTTYHILAQYLDSETYHCKVRAYLYGLSAVSPRLPWNILKQDQYNVINNQSTATQTINNINLGRLIHKHSYIIMIERSAPRWPSPQCTHSPKTMSSDRWSDSKADINVVSIIWKPEFSMLELVNPGANRHKVYTFVQQSHH